MEYEFKTFDARTDEVVEWLGKEFAGIRTGRATPALLDGVQVESYGARVPIVQVGTVGVEDPRTLRVTSWDKSNIKAIEKAISDADLGVSVIPDDTSVRVIFPELTGERREQLMKIARAKLEEARISVRGARDEEMKDIEKKEKAGELTEDDKYRMKDVLQKRIDAVNEKLNHMLEKKEAEINQ